MSTPMKIVVIDDSEDDRLLYRRALQKSAETEYSIAEASEGEAGLTLIREEKPACVLLDYSLPGRNGVEILKAIRGHDPFMPIVMLTGQGNEAVAVSAIQQGAQNYISKSTITPETLEHVIRLAIEHCRLQKRIHDQHISLEVFTRALAHDLKEPVRTIRSFAELIRQDENFSEETAHRFDHIQNAANRMHLLIDSVFFYTRLEAPDQASREICRTADIVKEAQENLARLIQEHKARIICANLPQLYVNRIQLMQVIQNLIGNAINHSEATVTIQISAEEKEEQWLFRVQDNGPGIEPEYLEKIFEPFRRLRHQEQQGAGLGLAICQRIIESHNGKIWCESQPGQGAAFVFTLPKALPQLAPAVSEKASMGAAPAKTGAQTLANVLLVDDSRADRELVKLQLLDLAHMQCNFFVARGGEEALALLQEKVPQHGAIDLILLDINMPEMNGFEVLEKIRQNESLKNTAVVMCTGSIYDKDMERSQQLGAIGYLNKPIEFTKLKSVIDANQGFHLQKQDDQYLLLRAA